MILIALIAEPDVAHLLQRARTMSVTYSSN